MPLVFGHVVAGRRITIDPRVYAVRVRCIHCEKLHEHGVFDDGSEGPQQVRAEIFCGGGFHEFCVDWPALRAAVGESLDFVDVPYFRRICAHVVEGSDDPADVQGVQDWADGLKEDQP